MKRTNRILAAILAVVMLVTSMAVPGFAVETSDFTDFPKNTWSTEAMTAAVANGLLVGTSDTTIEPAKNLTRAEFAAIVTRAFGATEKADISNFKDVNESHWFYESVAKVVQMGVMNGTSTTTFDPNSYMRREDVFLALARILFVDGEDTTVLNQFSDREDIDTWSVKAISGMVAEGYVNGYEDGTIRPRNIITRQELAQLFHNIFKTYISEEGTYDSVAAEGSVIVRSNGVTLKDVTVNGDLIMADGIGKGDFRLTNVKVTGKIIARGGEGTVYFTKVTSEGNVIINDPNGVVNFHNYRDEAPFVNNLVENTQATFLERTSSGPSGPSGPSTKTLKFDPDKNVNNDETTIKKTSSYVIKATDVPEDPTKTGYTFEGWSKQGSSEVHPSSYFVGKKISAVAGTYYAVYVAKEYTVTFMDNDDVTELGKDSAPAGNALDNVPAPEKTDYTLAGWATTPNATVVEFTTNDLTTKFVEENFGDTTEIKLYPVFVLAPEEEYTITFNANEGVVSPETATTVDGKLTSLPIPERGAGFNFEGWFTAPVGGEEVTTDTVFTEDTEIFAHWSEVSAAKYIVNFDANGGRVSPLSDVTGTDGKLTSLPLPNRGNGYTFDGWFTAPVGGEKVTIDTVFTADTTIYAQWTEVAVNSFVVNFNANGGTVTPVSDVTDENGKLTSLPTPNRGAGFAFKGWFTQAEGGEAVTTDTVFDADTEIFAQWIEVPANAFVVNFNANGGTVTPVSVVTDENGKLASLPTPNHGAGYTFMGWFTQAGEEVTTDTVFTADTEIVAKWEKADPNTFVVNFNANGGTVSPLSGITGTDGKLASLPTPNHGDGYAFKGWFTAAVGGEAVTTDTVFTEDTEIFAQWTEVPSNTFVVNFNANGGTVSPLSDITDTNGKLASLPTPNRGAGYTFKGWFTAPVGGVAITEETVYIADTVIYAQWTEVPANTFVVNFNANGGTVSPLSDVTGTDGKLTSLPTPNHGNGYRFNGWFTAPVGGEEVTLDKVYTENTEIYAQWTEVPSNKYVVNFNANGGTVSPLSAITDENGKLASLPTPNHGAGYAFKGWFTQAVDGDAVTTDTVFTADTEIFAQWIEVPANTFVVNFNANGGTVSPLSAVTGTDGKLTSLPTPNRGVGYVFNGWFTEAVGGEEVTLDNVYTENTEIFAQWTEVPVNTFVVTFNANGGRVSPVSDVTDENGKLASLPTPERGAGYTFDGWFTAAVGGEKVTLDKVYTENTEIFAQWTEVSENTFVVNFDANGGRVSPLSDVTGTDGKLTSLPTPERGAGYTFEGWFTEAEGGDAVTLDKVYTEDTTIYAHWAVVPVDEFVITFNANGGVVTPETAATVDGKLTSLPTPNRGKGYTFDGWFTQAVGGEEVTTDTVFTEDTEIFAHWTIVPVDTFVVNFNANGGTVSPLSDVTGEDGKLATLPTPNRGNGYTFKGWFTEAVGGEAVTTDTVFTEDTEIFAQWTEVPANTFVVNFNANGGTVSPLSDVTGTDGKLASLPTPNRGNGYTFKGWFTEAVGGEAVTIDTVYTEDTEIFAQWTEVPANTFVVNFDANGGTVSPLSDVTGTDGKLTSLPTPNRGNGYIFNGWFTQAEGGEEVTLDKVYTENTTIYAQWTQIPGEEFEITFDANGGTVTPATATTVYGKLASLPTPEYEGYNFLGWFTQSEGGEEVTTNTVFFEDTTIFAHWDEVIDEYVITFVQGTNTLGTIEVSEHETIVKTDVEAIEALVTVETTQLFKGWATTEGSNVVEFTADTMSSDVVENVFNSTAVTLYPVIVDKDDVEYKIEYYFEDLDGVYTVNEDYTVTAYAKPTVVVDGIALTDIPAGYEENTEHSDRNISMEIVDADEDLVADDTLRYYYKLIVLTVEYIDMGDVVMTYEVKYGGTMDNFVDPSDTDKTSDEIKQEIDDYIEFLAIPGYGKDYDDKYIFTKFNDKLGGDYYYEFGKYPYEHEINLHWYVEDDVEEYVLFDEEHVFTEDLDIFSKIMKLNIEISFPEKLSGGERLNIYVPYEESTRFVDSVRDMLFINDHISTYPADTGIEEKLYEKLPERFITPDRELKNPDFLIYFYQMMGGKEEFSEWLWDEVEDEVIEGFGGDQTWIDRYNDFKAGRDSETSLRDFFENHLTDEEMAEDAISESYLKYVASDKFIYQATHNDTFEVTVFNEFIMEKVDEKLVSLRYIEDLLEEYGGGRIPEGLIKRLPVDEFKGMYEDRITYFLDMLETAIQDAHDTGAVTVVPSGIKLDVNIVEEIVKPLADFARDKHEALVNKAKNSSNRGAELFYKYYGENPYASALVGDYVIAEKYFEDTGKKDEEINSKYGYDFNTYKIQSFENIYKDVLMPLSVEAIDALLWYFDEEGGSVDFSRIRKLAEANEDLILALINHPNDLMYRYAQEGLPEDIAQYWDDLLENDEIRKAVEKIDGKVDFELAEFVEAKLQTAILEQIYLKVLNKAGVPVELLLSKYTDSAAYKNYTHEDFVYYLDEFEKAFATVELEDADGNIVDVVNGNATTDYVYTELLKKFGVEDNDVYISAKNFSIDIKKEFVDYLEETNE